MLELNSIDFLRAATMLARLNQVLRGLTAAQQELLVPATVEVIVPTLDEFKREADGVGARLAVMAAERMLERVRQEPCSVTVGEAAASLMDLESRFSDYLWEVKMFALAPAEAIFMQDADRLIENEGFAIIYPNASFELEEASKCLAFGRYTAAVFHAMRLLEIGIRALAKRLSIPDPTRPAEKNWGIILSAMQLRIDELWPRQKRLANTEGSAFEALHALLEAVRNPWRNATMHVETIYAPHEALHILRCSAFFMNNLSKLCDEAGQPVQREPALISEQDMTPGSAG